MILFDFFIRVFCNLQSTYALGLDHVSQQKLENTVSNKEFPEI